MASFFESATERHPYLPVIVFVIVPACLILLFYILPRPFPLILTIVGLIVFSLFTYYVTKFKQEDTAALGSAIPNLLGPFLAYLYIHGSESPLREIVDKGGDVLVQLAFTCASLIGLIVYLIIKLERAPALSNERRKLEFGLILLVTVFFLIMGYGKEFAPIDAGGGPVIYGWFSGPARTPLTAVRIILGLFSVSLAAWPRNGIPQTDSTPVTN